LLAKALAAEAAFVADRFMATASAIASSSTLLLGKEDGSDGNDVLKDDGSEVDREGSS
jgi:hypothetical protein